MLFSAVPTHLLDLIGPIRLLALDVDGVLTDGSLHLGDQGEVIKVFCAWDGQGIKLLQESGIEVAIISSRQSLMVERRAAELGIKKVLQGHHEKLTAWQSLLTELGLQPKMSAYIGDDLPDLPILRNCGLACTVPGAFPLVKQHVAYVTQRAGGMGAVREVCELILAGQGKLGALYQKYLAE